MSAETFPTLLWYFTEDWEEGPAVDLTIRTPMENGLVKSRKRYTNPILKWVYTLRMVSNVDKALLDTFEKTTVSFGAVDFNWNHPIETTKTYEVKFAAPIEWRREPDDGTYFAAKISLVELAPNSLVVV